MIEIDKIGVIGYITRDKVIKEFYSTLDEKIGGKSFYCGLALANLGVPTVVFNKVGMDDFDLLDNLKHENIDLVNFMSNRTPVFENFFLDRDLEERDYKAVNDSFVYSVDILDKHISKLKGCSYVHLAPGKNNEIPLDSVRYLRNNLSNSMISLDVEHLLFENVDGSLESYLNPDLSGIIENVDILQVSRRHLSDIADNLNIAYAGDICGMAESLSEHGPQTVIVTQGSMGSIIYSDKRFYHIEPYYVDVVDTTGAGDTHIAGFLHGMLATGGDVKLSGMHAGYVAAKKIENGGPLPARIPLLSVVK
ncbi:MAG: hypothetical protein KAS11_00180 [Candidatus Aenigmarchaeota archaeon]|nr:hypothetical protein [Candidatus Aenigmarchaeota archaeon]